MKRYLLLSIFFAAVIWLAYAAVLLGLVPESWLPASFAKLTLPTSKSDFGQAFNAIEGLTSSLALVLGLVAIILQVRQTAQANEIGELSARQQFLLADHHPPRTNSQFFLAPNTKFGYSARPRLPL
jgi:hypothetical protein